jgi:hypothetical protein
MKLFNLKAHIIANGMNLTFGGQEWARSTDEAIVKFFERMPHLVRGEYGVDATFEWQKVEYPIACYEASDSRL